MSGGRSWGPRALAASTPAVNSFAVAAGMLAIHAASMRSTSSFCRARRSRSAFECFATSYLQLRVRPSAHRRTTVSTLRPISEATGLTGLPHEKYAHFMKATRISKGGQIQVPASVRRRWATDEILIQDYGTFLRIVPIPDDPIGAVSGSLGGPGPTVNEMMRQLREEEAEAEERKLRLMRLVR